jgi:hypothetical protein
MQKKISWKKSSIICLFFIARAKNMPKNMDTLTALGDTTFYTQKFRTVTQFIKELKAAGSIGLRWDTKFYPDEIHGTVQLNGQI